MVRLAESLETPIQTEVLIDGPFAASTLFWRARRGELRCSIIAKTTYALLPRHAPIVEPPDALRTSDASWDGALSRSVRTPSDLVPFKHSPEVMLVGHAYAPGKKAASRLAVRLLVGDLDTALEVFPPRRFTPEGALEEPIALRMPLAYEHAAGGSDTDNPVGVDMELVDAWGRRGAPSVLPLGAQISHPSDPVDTAGWGPIGTTWPSRSRRLRAEDRAWLADPARTPMPQAFDVRFFQSAPHQSWLTGPIRPDERIVLENLSPSYPRLVTNLDGVVPYASVMGSKELRVPLIADTLFIDTDRAVITLTWRGLVLVDESAPHLTIAVAPTPGRGSVAPPPTAEERAALLAEVETTHVETLPDGVAKIPMPFAVAAPIGRGLSPDYDDDALPFRTPDADLSRTRPRHALRLTPLPPEPAKVDPPPPSTPSPPPPRASLSSTPEPPKWEPPRASGGGWAPPVEPKGRIQDVSKKDGISPAPQVKASAAGDSGSRAGPREWMSLRSISDAAAEGGAGQPRGSSAERSGPDTERDRDRKNQPRDPGEPRRYAFVDLLAHDPQLLPRLRRTASLAKILAAQGERPAWVRPDEPKEERSRDDRDRMDVLRVLSFSPPCDLPRVRELVDDAFDDPTQLELPLVVVAGQLKPSPDDLATLRATVRAGQPLSLTNKPLQAALKVLEEAVDSGVAPPGEATQALLRQAEQAAGTMWGYLHAQVQRIVLEERQFKKRTVLGEPRIRADLSTPAGETVPAYIPASVLAKLPMLAVFPVVVLGELRPREDAQESHAEAFLVGALGRVVRQPSAGRGAR
ncbi:MAG: DUF2169 domain-containing protein [Polyangiaceae bacterium]